MKIVQTNFKYRSPLTPLNLDKVLYIVLHHTASFSATPEEIHQWHLERFETDSKGNKVYWNGFGYNEYIRKDGTVYIGRGDFIGAQCANLNSKSYGICLEGNYDIEKEMPEEQFNSLVERLRFNKQRFKNLVDIEAHRKFNLTSCPGKYFPFEKAHTEASQRLDQKELAINLAYSEGIISSPDYWVENTVKGKVCKGEYVGILFNNIGTYIRKNK